MVCVLKDASPFSVDEKIRRTGDALAGIKTIAPGPLTQQKGDVSLGLISREGVAFQAGP